MALLNERTVVRCKLWEEILKKIRSEMPEIKLNLDPAKIESKDLHEFKERILEKIEENLDNKVFFAPKENIKNLDKLFFSEFMLKKMIRDIEDKNPEVVYLYSDSIKYIKALDDFYKLNTNYNNQHIPLKDLEFLKQFPKNYTCLTNNKHNLILANADLYNKQASSKISPLKHEIYHAIEGSLIEEAPLFFLGYILPEATKNYQMCKKYDNDPAKYGSPGVKDEQGKTHEFLGSYSALYKDEYSANTFSAYFDNEGNKILKENDPIQHTFIENLTNLLNLAKDISRKK
ncbi:MAG: hypothetical protein HYU63_02145 [Armatimonadetes bacterium]|nr:hypothetical protein [Armatimonadota bacterium]